MARPVEDIKTIEDLEKEVEKIFLLEDKGLVRIVVASIIANRMALDPVWLLLVAPSSGGKCVHPETPILMYDGSIKKAKEVVRGDKLMGDDSTPRLVKSTTSGIDTMYRIEQESGEDYIVNSQHILSLKYTHGRPEYKGFKKDDTTDIALQEYIAKSRNFKNSFNGYKVAVDFPKKEIPLDPYFLGIWLGDGHMNGPIISKPDKEITEYMRSFAAANDMDISVIQYHKKDCPRIALKRTIGSPKENKIWAIMRGMGLDKKKHIPFDYKTNDRATRLQLLAGLLDTDGSLNEQKNFEFSCKDETLAKDVVFLVRSLGFKATATSCVKTIKSIGFSGTYWRVYISGPLHLIPTKIKRKQAKVRSHKNDVLSTHFKVKKLKKGTYNGFTLDGNGRFLLGDFTVTHNTELIHAISKLEFVHPISDLTVNTFASGLKRPGQHTSLLLKMTNGIMAFKDFTSVLSKNKDARREIMAQLREIYDGEYVKRTGNANDIVWHGKLGAIAGATEAVYRHLEELSAMGDRFVMYSIAQPDRLAVAERALDNAHLIHESRDLLQKYFTHYITDVLKDVDTEEVILEPDIKKELLMVADFATRVRSAVMRDFKTNLVDFVPSPEMPMRVTGQLYTLSAAILLMKKHDYANSPGKKDYVPKIDELDKKILYKTAFDSIPKTRRMALMPLAKYKDGVTTAGLATALDLPTQSVQKYLQEVNALGICTRKKTGGKQGDTWTLRNEYREIMLKLDDVGEVFEGSLESDSIEMDDIEGAWNQTDELPAFDFTEPAQTQKGMLL